MRSISYPAFSELKASCVVGNDLWIATAKEEGTLLSDLLKRRDYVLPQEAIAKICFEVCLFDWLHQAMERG